MEEVGFEAGGLVLTDTTGQPLFSQTFGPPATATSNVTYSTSTPPSSANVYNVGEISKT